MLNLSYTLNVLCYVIFVTDITAFQSFAFLFTFKIISHHYELYSFNISYSFLSIWSIVQKHFVNVVSLGYKLHEVT